MEAAVVFLIESKESIDVTKELLVVMFANPVVVVVSSRSGGKTKGDHILRSPGKIKTAMQFSQKEGNNAIVDSA